MNKVKFARLTVALFAMGISYPATAAQFDREEAQAKALSFYRAVSNYSPEHSNEMLLKSRPFFASSGAYQQFRKTTENSGYFEGAKRYRMTVSSTLGEPRSEMAVDGSWHVSFEAKVSHRPPEGVGLDRCVLVQVSLRPSSDRLGVSSITEDDCPTK